MIALGVLVTASLAIALAQETQYPIPTSQVGTTAEASPKVDKEGPSSGQLSARQIMERAVAKDIVNWQAAKDYTFFERTQEDALDSDGKVKSSKSETHEIMVLYGEPFERMVAKDDKPLPEKDQQKQNEKFDKETHKRENETPEERQKRQQKYEKEREDERAFVREVLDAYDFSLIGTETVNGRVVWAIDAVPRPGFEGKRRESKMLPKIKPRFWIDQQDYSWVKLRAEVIDTLSFGVVVARLHKGSVFEMQQVRVNDELWLPQRFDVKLDARVALLKGVNENVHVTYSDYRKFRTETKTTLAGPNVQ
jgi:hypothetical protein